MTRRIFIIHQVCKGTLADTPAYSTNIETEEWRRCVEHGIQKLVPKYEFKTDPITKVQMDLLYWGCPKCFARIWGEPKEVELECCSEGGCKETTNLMDCPLCGEPVCKKHSIEGICMECVDEGKLGMTS